jgi:hypothetical protein
VLEFKGVVHGPLNAEDLARIPGTPWIITSGMRGPTVPQGHLYLIHSRDRSCSEAFPYRVTSDHDTATYGAEVTMLDPRDFEPHGLDIGTDPHGDLCVYVVHHGARESIEIFRIELSERPSLCWVGAVIMPVGTFGNDVACLPGGGFLVSSSADISEGVEIGFARSMSGEKTGKVVEWSPTQGWSTLPGSEINSANGIAVSPDGKWVFVAGWRPKNLVRVSRGDEPVVADEIATGILTDNLTWTAGGQLLATGAFDTTPDQFMASYMSNDPSSRFPTRVVRIDAVTLECSVLAGYDGSTFGVGTTALEVDDELWVGSARFEGIARLATVAAT